MRITKIELHPRGSGSTCSFDFRDAERAGSYNAQSVSGLDADEIVARYYGSGAAGKLYSLSMLKREIGFKVSLNPNMAVGETYSSLRDQLYRLIASSRTGMIDIQFKDGSSVKAVISGTVSKLESPLFEQDPVVQMTITCPDAMLKAPDRFNYPIGDVFLPHTVLNVGNNDATAPSGLTFAVEFLAPKATFSLYDPMDDSWAFDVSPPGGFLIGDELHFSSELNNKYLYILRGSDEIHIADSVAPGAGWPLMFPGINHFVVPDADGEALSWLEWSWVPAFWGV